MVSIKLFRFKKSNKSQQTMCSAEHPKMGKEVLNCVVPCGIGQLFKLLFTNSKFYTEFQYSRQIIDILQTEWRTNNGFQTRTLSYATTSGLLVGPKQFQLTEIQTVLPSSQAGSCLVIQSETVNAGVPQEYAFSVKCHYCLRKISSTETSLVVVSKVKFAKFDWKKAFLKGYAKNTLASYFRNLESALRTECSKKAYEAVPSKQLSGKRRSSRDITSAHLEESKNVALNRTETNRLVNTAEVVEKLQETEWGLSEFFRQIILAVFLLIMVLLFNAYSGKENIEEFAGETARFL